MGVNIHCRLTYVYVIYLDGDTDIDIIQRSGSGNQKQFVGHHYSNMFHIKVTSKP